MIELKGKYNSAKVFVSELEGKTKEQILKLLNDELSEYSKIRIMPDTHAGQDGVIGLTMTIENKVAPSLVGSDIGCGVALYHMKFKNLSLKDLDEAIHELIPYGYKNQDLDLTDVNKVFEPTETAEIYALISSLKCIKRNKLDFVELYKKALMGLGTLGGGNHFIEAYEENDDSLFISVHTGSRGLGGAVYKYYESISINKKELEYIEKRERIIRDLKTQNRHKEIALELEKLKVENNWLSSPSKPLFKYLYGVDMDDYIHDVEVLTEYARLNRRVIIKKIVGKFNTEAFVIADQPHNYIERNKMILRKGSQSAEGTILIPINMRDGMIIGEYKDFSVLEDWNFSAPHGAGRVLSRTVAKEKLNIDTFKEQMKEIYSTTVSEETLDESPDAYKTLSEIKENISENIRIIKILKPCYNFKGGSENPRVNKK